MRSILTQIHYWFCYLFFFLNQKAINLHCKRIQGSSFLSPYQFHQIRQHCPGQHGFLGMTIHQNLTISWDESHIWIFFFFWCSFATLKYEWGILQYLSDGVWTKPLPNFFPFTNSGLSKLVNRINRSFLVLKHLQNFFVYSIFVFTVLNWPCKISSWISEERWMKHIVRRRSLLILETIITSQYLSFLLKETKFFR